MRARRLQLFGLALAVAMVFLVGACGGSSTPVPGAADIEVLERDGFSVADYSGSPLVVNFFGSWCGPCKSQAPDLAEFAAAHPEVQFIGIAESDKESAAVAFMQEFGLEYSIILDDNSLGQAMSITGVPTTIFFNAAGQEADRLIGAAGLTQFEESLAKAQ